VDEHPGVVSRERLAYGPQLTKLVSKTSRSDSLHMRRKCQLGVDSDAETRDAVWRRDAAVLEWHDLIL